MAKVLALPETESVGGLVARKLSDAGYDAALAAKEPIPKRELDAILAAVSDTALSARAVAVLTRLVDEQPAVVKPYAAVLFVTVKKRYVDRVDASEMDAAHAAVLLTQTALAFSEVARPHVLELSDNAIPRGGAFGLLFHLSETFHEEMGSRVLPVTHSACAQVMSSLDDPTVGIAADVLLSHLASAYPTKREEMVEAVISETFQWRAEHGAELMIDDVTARNKYEGWFDFVSNFICESDEIAGIAANELVKTYLEYPREGGSKLPQGAADTPAPNGAPAEFVGRMVRQSAHELLGYSAYLSPESVAPHVDTIFGAILRARDAGENPWLDKRLLHLATVCALNFPVASERFMPQLVGMLEPVIAECAKSCPSLHEIKAVALPVNLPDPGTYATALGAVSRVSTGLRDDVSALLLRALEKDLSRDWAVRVLSESSPHVERRWGMAPHILRSLDEANPAGRRIVLVALSVFLPSRAEAPPEFRPPLERAAGEVEAFVNELIGRRLTEPEAEAFCGSARTLEALQLPPILGKISIAATIPFLARNNLKEDLAGIGAPLLPREQLMAWMNLNGSAQAEAFAGFVPLIVSNPPVLREFNSLVKLKTGKHYWAMSGHAKEVYADEILESAANVMPTLRDILSARLREINALKNETAHETEVRTRTEFAADIRTIEQRVLRTADTAIREARGKPNADAIIAKQERIKAAAHAIAEREARDLAKECERVLAQRLKLRREQTGPIEAALQQIDAFLESVEFVRPKGDSHRLLSRCKSELRTGAATADCTAPGGINAWSVPVYLIDFGYQSLIRFHDGKVFSRLDIVLSRAGGKPAIIIDAIEAVPWSDDLPPAEREVILAEEFARVIRIAKKIGACVYAGNLSNRDWVEEYVEKAFPSRNVSVEKLAGLEFARAAIKKFAGVDLSPQMYLQSFSSSSSFTEREQEAMHALEQAINLRMESISGLKDALLARDFETAASLLEADPVAWEKIGGHGAIPHAGIVEILARLYTPSAMSGNPKLAVVFEA